MNPKKQITQTINAAIKNGDPSIPIIGRDAFAPKKGKGEKTAKTLTALVKEARTHADNASQSSICAENMEENAEAYARTAKWSAAIAVAAAIVSIISNIV